MKENYDSLDPINGLNYVQLSPISFLQRAADVYSHHPSIIYGSRRYDWKNTARRCRRLASALKKLGVEKGTTVAMMAANTPELAEAHFGVPMSGAVLNAINTRLDPDTVAYILEHGDARVLITDTHFSNVIGTALELLENPPLVIDIEDLQAPAPQGAGQKLGQLTYEELLDSGDASSGWGLPQSEWDALTLNYTSGTSGRPKGVVYHHRGSYLMSMGTVAAWQIPKHARYLCTVPMFHCNGWGHAWTMALMGGTLICNRAVTAENIFSAIREHRVTHFGAAPIVLAMLANAPDEVKFIPDYEVQVMTAGAPPPSKVLEKSQQLGFNVIHVYGLTETYGHVMFCDWKNEWSGLTIEEQAEIKARQGVRFPMMDAARVIDVDSGEEVAADGNSIGEIVLKGNPVMKGYYKSPEATAEAFRDGWFHSGDLAVVHANGYMEIKDRLKDIIISGGENISSIEVESVLYKFPKVAAAAVVAKPDEKWGETPCAFVELKQGEEATEEEIIAFCKDNMAGYKRPKQVVFIELPKTSTGKIQKFRLREMVAAGEV
jgi:fatty-acyl-CoA synthase